VYDTCWGIMTKGRCFIDAGRGIQFSILALMVFLSGCATTLTEAGRKIKVVHDGNSDVVSGCIKLVPVKGEARSLLSGGDYGVIYATNDARNKAARTPDADTLVIDDNPSRVFGGEVNGTAYNCSR
jgi:hypothetical protein